MKQNSSYYPPSVYTLVLKGLIKETSSEDETVGSSPSALLNFMEEIKLKNGSHSSVDILSMVLNEILDRHCFYLCDEVIKASAN
eukprot:Awhi_evm1s11724